MRVQLRIVLRRPLCEGPRLRIRTVATGGIDGDDGNACMLVGYLVKSSAAATC